MIERHNAKNPLKTQAQLLGLSRASLYYHPVGPTAQEIACKHRIDEIYTKYPFYGSRRVTAVLRREGRTISRPTVQKYMREMGIAGIAPGLNLSKPHPEHKVYPYLLRGLRIERPNQVWSIDITYIPSSRRSPDRARSLTDRSPLALSSRLPPFRARKKFKACNLSGNWQYLWIFLTSTPAWAGTAVPRPGALG